MPAPAVAGPRRLAVDANVDSQTWSVQLVPIAERIREPKPQRADERLLVDAEVRSFSQDDDSPTNTVQLTGRASEQRLGTLDPDLMDQGEVASDAGRSPTGASNRTERVTEQRLGTVFPDLMPHAEVDSDEDAPSLSSSLNLGTLEPTVDSDDENGQQSLGGQGLHTLDFRMDGGDGQQTLGGQSPRTLGFKIDSEMDAGDGERSLGGWRQAFPLHFDDEPGAGSAALPSARGALARQASPSADSGQVAKEGLGALVPALAASPCDAQSTPRVSEPRLLSFDAGGSEDCDGDDDDDDEVGTGSQEPAAQAVRAMEPKLQPESDELVRLSSKQSMGQSSDDGDLPSRLPSVNSVLSGSIPKSAQLGALLGRSKIMNDFLDPEILERLDPIVDEILESDPESAKQQSSNGFLPLHVAAQNGHKESVHTLLVAFPEGIRHQAKNGYLPIHVAAAAGHVEIVQSLLAVFPKSAKWVGINGFLPLHLAAANGHTEIVEVLLEKFPGGARCEDGLGHLPLRAAAANGHKDIVDLLLVAYPDGARHMGDERRGRFLPIHAAAQNGHKDIVDALLAAFPSGATKKTKNGELPLHLAASSINTFGHEYEQIVHALVVAFPRGVKQRNIRHLLPWEVAAEAGAEEGLLDLLVPAAADSTYLISAARSEKQGGRFAGARKKISKAWKKHLHLP